jgi:hypothetical protein
MARPHARRRRRPLALELVATVAARARARLTPLAVAATTRRPAVLATFFVPAHSSSAKFITFIAPARAHRVHHLAQALVLTARQAGVSGSSTASLARTGFR